MPLDVTEFIPILSRISKTEHPNDSKSNQVSASMTLITTMTIHSQLVNSKISSKPIMPSHHALHFLIK